MKIVFVFLCSLITGSVIGQSPKKQVNDQSQSWFSVNSTFRLNEKWGVVGDLHIRRSNFMADPNFYFVRAGAGYWFNKQLNFVAGYAHMWLASAKKGERVFVNEDRLYGQLAYSTKLGKLALLHRFRNEHRWKESVVGDDLPNKTGFSTRLRYLISLTYPVFKNPNLPQACLANEVLVQFGKPIVNNTFDQLRLFAGIRQTLGRGWSFDCGYMMLYQQRASGYQYDRNHTFRLFFYYTLNPKPVAPAPAPEYEDE
ncbi:DUF2490 domain-containing protein [Pseudoflavitalea sp. G-6-1-2]|uniref:DUF2490 domain-containing protein n=1 Tax=Pseudoflavitalea sp. G-6-1-2 TaxID=2728841 RepID=UPI00146A5D23|nr:DUF2490 domain-containing protein [Pseudoflavitalea sp. G-6-1-2]NML24067.1 DUF2490 domain-containing protein [Pseudoflavitalea sp. G-6-1-2]